MCCNLLSLVTCCGLCSPLKRCCCFIPLRCGVLIFAIFFIVVDGIILIAYADRMNYFQKFKNEADYHLMRAKEKVEMIADPTTYKAAGTAMEDAAQKVRGGFEKVGDTVNGLSNNINREERSTFFGWESDKRMKRILDMFGSDSPSDDGGDAASSGQRGVVLGSAEKFVASPSPSQAAPPSSSSAKQRWQRRRRRRLVKRDMGSLDERGIFWNDDTIADENKDLPGSETFKILFAIEIENIIFAVIWWCMAFYLLICGACNLKCCAIVWVVAMIVRCVEILIHVFVIAYSCWWLKSCSKVAFPNIMSIVIFVVIPYSIVVVISWIVSE